MDDILKQAEEIINPKPKETYCSFLLHSLVSNPFFKQENFELIKCNYVLDGLEAVVRDKKENQDYRITIKPI